MLPLFLNPVGFWALLGLPAVVAIHFLQQRLRRVRTSTWFLIENLAPDSAQGRTWERLRPSRAFWLQLLAVLLLTWVLVQPRWVRSESAQTVAVVLDSAAAMGAFRVEAIRAAADRLAAADGRAARMEWLVLSSDPRQPPLYRGGNRMAAEAALARWQPELGTHDPRPALRLARTLAGRGGLTWFITDRRDHLEPDQAAVGVGRPLANAGFAGVTVAREGGGHAWRALVRNHADEPQARRWWIEAAGGRTPEQVLDLAPGALVELAGRFPDGLDRCTVVLAGDGFPADDRLPLVRPVPKALTVAVDLEGGEAEFFRRLAGAVDGVNFAPVPAPGLRVARTVPSAPGPASAAVLLPVPAAATGGGTRVVRAPVVTERHPLAGDLNWQGWLGPGAGPLEPAAGDTVLLWQSERPLAWTGGGDAARRHLVLNFDWASTNAARLPATVLLLRRFLEGVRDAQPGAYAANFDCAADVPLAEADRVAAAGAVVEFEPAAGGTAATSPPLGPGALASLRAPGAAGFFTVQHGATVLVRGAAQFADVRQGDFRNAETFVTGPPAEAEALLERNTLPDPFTALWLALAGLGLLGSWWPAGRRA